jgi:hypothetical protein
MASFSRRSERLEGVLVVPTGRDPGSPAGIPHRWLNAGDDLLEFSGRLIPAVDLDRYLLMFSTLAPPVGHRHSADRLPRILFIRHILGKYPRIKLAQRAAGGLVTGQPREIQIATTQNAPPRAGEHLPIALCQA